MAAPYSTKFRMPSGIPGALSADSQSTIEAIRLSRTVPFDAFGLPGKIVDNEFTPLEAGDTAESVYGMLVRPYPTQGNTSNGFGPGAPGTGPYAGVIADVLRRGYMSVECVSGTPALNGPVYVQVANGTSDNPIGSIRADEPGTASDAVAIDAIFMSQGDEAGNVEIAYNI